MKCGTEQDLKTAHHALCASLSTCTLPSIHLYFLYMTIHPTATFILLHSSLEPSVRSFNCLSTMLQLVLDPSRNFAHYRNLLTSPPQSPQTGAQCFPLLPYLPLVLKDLTFIHLGNPSRSAATSASSSACPQLINFAKLRMFAKEVSED